MRVVDTLIAGVKIVELDTHEDARGYFIERFHTEKFAALGLPTDFKQDNHSRSHPNVLRGMHYQHTPAQGKLVGVIRGKIWDVGVDVRAGSPTFGQHVAVELSEENGRLLWLPAGIAHGFCVLGDGPADVTYKVTGIYKPGGEGGIRFDDPDLGIDWPLKNPMVSERDAQLPAWQDYAKNPLHWDE